MTLIHTLQAREKKLLVIYWWGGVEGKQEIYEMGYRKTGNFDEFEYTKNMRPTFRASTTHRLTIKFTFV